MKSLKEFLMFSSLHPRPPTDLDLIQNQDQEPVQSPQLFLSSLTLKVQFLNSSCTDFSLISGVCSSERHFTAVWCYSFHGDSLRLHQVLQR